MSGRHSPSKRPHVDTELELVHRPLRERLARPAGRHRPANVEPTAADWTGEAQDQTRDDGAQDDRRTP